jgi:hypothetical protein
MIATEATRWSCRVMDDSTKGSEPEAQPDRRVRFDYIKSGSFRVIHADGVVGGLTPRLDIHIDFWSERFPIPQQVAYALNQDGTLGEEVKEERKTRDSIVREVEAGVVMDLESVRAFRDWLNDRIAEVERILAEHGPQNQ